MLLFGQNPELNRSVHQVDAIDPDQAGSLCGLLIERVRRSPEGAAYTHWDARSGDWVTRSWSETLAEVARWQAALGAEALTAGDRVAIMSANRPEWVHFDLAALGLGLVTVPLYATDRPESVRYALADSGARLLLVESATMAADLDPIAATLEGLARRLVLEPDPGSPAEGWSPVADWLPPTAGTPTDRVKDPRTLATIVYTSGTTGPAKGVMLSHGNLLWNAAASLKLVPAWTDDRFLSFLPLSHTLERTAGYYLAVMAGAEVVYARSIPQLADDIETHRPTVLIAVPRIFERIHAKLRDKLAQGPALARRLFDAAVSAGWAGFRHRQGLDSPGTERLLAPALDRLVGRKLRARLGGRLRVAICGGAPLSPEIARTFVALGVPVLQGYGLTEASPVISVNTLEDNIPESVGLPLPGVELRIGPQDELLVRSPGVMSGYWNLPQASAAAVDQDGWLHTGDQARLERGHLFITGRIKDILVLATGEKVPAADLEMAILGDSLFSQVLVIGEGRPYLSALVVLDPDRCRDLALAPGPALEADGDGSELERVLLERIDRRLSTFPAYARIQRVAALPEPWSIEDGLMTPTMKLKRARILDQHRDQVTSLYQGHQ